MSTGVIIIFSALIFWSKAAVNCVYKDAANGYTLDLSYFQDFRISIPDSKYPGSYYNYTVCENDPHNLSGCQGVGPSPAPPSAMIWYYVPYTSPEECDAVAMWDDFQFQPTYTPNNQTWYFYYHNGPNCHHSDLDYTWTAEIFWICDNTTEYEVHDTSDTCHEKLYIHSKYVCPSVPPPINNTCSWTSGVDNQLNLTSIAKEVIVGQDSNNISQIFIYTPCNNDITCESTKAMAVLDDFETNSCSKYLAVWEGVNGADMNVNYNNANNGSWQFVFTNGEKCNGGYENVFEVYWICDKNVNPFRLISSTTTGICSYQMIISSDLACS